MGASQGLRDQAAGAAGVGPSSPCVARQLEWQAWVPLHPALFLFLNLFLFPSLSHSGVTLAFIVCSFTRQAPH